jgi:hypothetical protein
VVSFTKFTCLTAPGVGGGLEWSPYLGASLLQATTSTRVYIDYDAPAVVSASVNAASASLLRTVGGDTVTIVGPWLARLQLF